MTSIDSELETKISRKAKAATSSLFTLALMIMMLNRYYAGELGIQGSPLFIVLGTALIVVGLALPWKTGDSPRVLDEQPNRTAHMLERAGSVITAVGVYCAIVVGYVMVAFPAEGVSIGVPPPHNAWLFSLLLSMLGLALAGFLINIAAETKAAWDKSGREHPVPTTLLAALRQIQPDKSFETKRFFAFSKGNVHIFLNKVFCGVHFVRLFKETVVPHGKMSVPFMRVGLHRKNVFKDKVNGLPKARIEGEFTIPVEVIGQGEDAHEKYVRGVGVLCYVSAYPLGHGLYPLDFRASLSERLDKLTILEVLDDLSAAKSK